MPKINKVYTTTNFRDKFQNLPKKIQSVATNKIFLFKDNFLHPSLNVHKLKGPLRKFWAFYITINYRVLFRFLKDNEAIFYDIDTHDIYKK